LKRTFDFDACAPCSPLPHGAISCNTGVHIDWHPPMTVCVAFRETAPCKVNANLRTQSYPHIAAEHMSLGMPSHEAPDTSANIMLAGEQNRHAQDDDCLTRNCMSKGASLKCWAANFALSTWLLCMLASMLHVCKNAWA